MYNVLQPPKNILHRRFQDQRSRDNLHLRRKDRWQQDVAGIRAVAAIILGLHAQGFASTYPIGPGTHARTAPDAQCRL